MKNPYTHTFGSIPEEYVPTELAEEIVENFSYENPSERIYMITGMRGSGKTVCLAKVIESLSQKDEWLIYNLNITRNLEEQLAAQLAEEPFVQKLFLKGSINISSTVISAGIEFNKSKVFDIDTLITKMVQIAKEKGKKILITIDDISFKDKMRTFAHTFQGLLIHKDRLPVNLIMTGVYFSASEIINDETLRECSFLTRLNDKQIGRLDESIMALSYMTKLKVSEKEAIAYAKQTKGYACAFQFLGCALFETLINKKDISYQVLYETDLYSKCYKPVWEKLSDRARDIVRVMVTMVEDGVPIKNEELRKRIEEQTGEPMSSSNMQNYKTRLKDNGIIDVTGNAGIYTFALPLFESYVRKYQM